MKRFTDQFSCVLLIHFFLVAYGLNHLQKPNPLENIEKRLDIEKESKLTENEKKLKQDFPNKRVGRSR